MKAPVSDLNNPILLLRRHLVVAGEAEAAAEEVGSDVDAAAGDIRVAPAPAVALPGDELMRPVDELHVHGFVPFS